MFGDRWIFGLWGEQYIDEESPSIEFLELFALCAGILTWAHLLTNCRIIVYCDNEAVVHMVNNMTSKCPQCMKLIRLLILGGLNHNRRVFVRHVKTAENKRADALSRYQFDHFWQHSKETTFEIPDRISSKLWPLEQIWFQ